ncbi:hypothetical protein D0861_01207 [Lecanosticta acicola]|uniref:histidine kinase n=1 Tax=Lecanosticta acicola TaxID=111012 RepID=A0AAI8YR95_9PEZI|nr:hypothetical protein D0861_01207 [Lecanosticta acicola]
MRIPIRIQLGSLLLISSLIGLAVISLATWVTVHDFVLSLRAQRLSLVASLKAAQLASNIDVMQTSASFVASRVIIQNALTLYYPNRNTSNSAWTNAQPDLQAAVGPQRSVGQELMIQAIVYNKDGTGVGDGLPGLFRATADYASEIVLPFKYPNGTPVHLGANDTFGYPPPLYPNLTYLNPPSNAGPDVPIVSYQGVNLRSDSTLILGPWMVNQTFSLLSLTLPIVSNDHDQDVIGWITAVMDSRLIRAVMDSTDGLGDSGETILLGPAASSNKFPSNITSAAAHNETPQYEVRFVLPLRTGETSRERHPDHVVGASNGPFDASDYPTIYKALAEADGNASASMGSNVRAKDEAGEPVSVGYAMAHTDAVDWIVLVEQSRQEVWSPINRLRVVILACLFATAVFMAVVSYPLAHFASLPILRLQRATARSIEPPSSTSRSSLDSLDGHADGTDDADEPDPVEARKEGFRNPVLRWKSKREKHAQTRRAERAKRAFRIPGKVKEQKHCIKDELSDLTRTFNEMSDELMMQYSKLEDRVQQRTAELELSKKAAEAANESKTLFIANISHELKTPLNGILGMCAVCMQENDPLRLKRSLGIIYKSGDLLLNLLTDLLTFSKNQVGQSLSLDEKDFRLHDISTQIKSIFEKQAKEGQIELRVVYEGVQHLGDGNLPELTQDGPAGTGRMKDMVLWGDVHRILQILINLVSNALKFTPRGGSVVLTIRCLPEVPEDMSGKTSLNSRRSRQPSSRHRTSESTLSIAKMSTANAINIKDKPHALAYVNTHERDPSPPPGRYLYFELEVTDTGPGIPEPLQERIFEPFVQGDLGLSKKFGGTGLGLSICSQLAHLMRGTIGVRSTIGVGSTFMVKIPLRLVHARMDSSASFGMDNFDNVSRSSSVDSFRSGTPSVAAERAGMQASTTEAHHPSRAGVGGTNINSDSQPRLVGLSQPFFAASQPLESPTSQPAAMKQISAEATRSGKLRVLVAEDNKVNQEVVLRMLKLEDIYDVTVAKDGQEALDMVKASMSGEDSQPFNLIFMDVQMPNVDGLQSTRLIREIGYRAPIVALTAFAEESNIKDCLDSGMNSFLSKPIRRPQLKKVLREYCAPIPEENEDVVPEERRGSNGVNTTLVISSASRPTNVANLPGASGTVFSQQVNSAADQSPGNAPDSRSVSPRCVS